VPAKPFVVPVPDLLHAPGARRHVNVCGPLRDVAVAGSELDDGADVCVDATLESVQEGILASGTVRAPWHAECRRCLAPVRGEVAASFRELFEEDPTEGESYPLRHEQIDLAALAREVVVLELPAAPLCREGCLGLCPRCGADLNEGSCDCVPEDRDPRWAALDALRPVGDARTEDD
jgi:uncharacterized protein